MNILKERRDMKRTGNIYYKICDIDNIKRAIVCASKGKRKRKNVQKVLYNIDEKAKEIQDLLKSKKYVPSSYTKQRILDGVNKKERIIYKPRFFPDQVIHWCLMLQIEEILQKPMYYYSCASIKNKGILFASKYIKQKLIQDYKNTKYCLKADIKKYYPSINKEILKSKIRKKIKCKDTLWLIDTIIDSSDEGLPIGNYTSQWFANFYLQEFDHFIKEKLHIKYYVRYMDDIVLFHKNKKELHHCKREIDNFLKNEKLELKGNWQVFKTDSRPLDFVGYRFYRGYTTLRRNNFLRIRRRIKKIYKKKVINEKDAAAVISYYGWIKNSNSRWFYKEQFKKYINIKKCKGVISDANRK